MEEKSIVMTTTENIEQATKIIDVVLNKKLAACVQTREIESHYVWEGKTCHDKEVLIWFKTEKRLITELEHLIKDYHPYEVPEIISIPIEYASNDYGAWMHDNLKK